MQFHCPFTETKIEQARGFTLVELLVVIGIIALLIGILLPTLNRVRDSARTLHCASDARQIATAALARAADARNHLPLAGHLRVAGDPGGYGAAPRALQDARREKYSYFIDTGFWSLSPLEEQVTPFPVALLPYLGSPEVELTSTAVADVGELTRIHSSLELFHCPDVADQTRFTAWASIRFPRIEVPLILQNRWDFVANEAVIGFDHRYPDGTARARGQLTRVVNPSRTAILGEADRLSLSPNIGRLFTWQPTLEPIDTPVTLRDLFEKTGRVDTIAPLDTFRHRGRANILFVDGHVESVPIEPGALEKVILRSAE